MCDAKRVVVDLTQSPVLHKRCAAEAFQIAENIGVVDELSTAMKQLEELGKVTRITVINVSNTGAIMKNSHSNVKIIRPILRVPVYIPGEKFEVIPVPDVAPRTVKALRSISAEHLTILEDYHEINPSHRGSLKDRRIALGVHYGVRSDCIFR